jgi:kumamolisin
MAQHLEKGACNRLPQQEHKDEAMPESKRRVPLPGSERAALPSARPVGAADPSARIEVTVVLRPRVADAGVTAAALSTQSPQERQYLSRAELAAASGADPNDVATVETFAHAHGLDVVETSLARRSVILAGTVAAFSTAFGVELQQYEHPSGTYRGRTGAIHVPEELAPIVQAVLGLDDRPQAAPHFRILPPTEGAAQPRATSAFTPLDLAKVYTFPTGLDGKGQTIAIIELGGGYRLTELKTYFTQLGITPPKVVSVSVDRKRNSPTHNPNSADGEVMLDIEVAGAMAPGARIVVYFAPNTDRGFLDAITTAVHDQRYKPSVMSISWGAPESGWTAQAMQAFDQAFQDAAALGVTVCCASGDNGSGDGVNDGKAHVDFPAASPYALACGGTRLDAAGGAIQSESVWNDGANGGSTGGGVSDTFALPVWQKNANVPHSANPGHHVGRGVPDVAADADPATGYRILVDGQAAVFGGTSAVAPLWAALIARFNQQLSKPVGHLNPLLYGPLISACHDITSGNNGAYQARAGWDACTGWGSPDGTKILTALRAAP